MSDDEILSEERDSAERTRSKVHSSKKRDPDQALSYWSKNKTKNAKPIPFPKPDEPNDKSNSGD